MNNPDLYLLEADCPIALEAACARLLQVVSGTVWITASDLPEDVFLQAGAIYQIPRNGHILMDAIHGQAQVGSGAISVRFLDAPAGKVP